MALLAAIPMAFIPAFFFSWFLYWLDRYEKEPLWLMLAAFGWGARRIAAPQDLDAAIAECLEHDGPFLLDVAVVAQENCFPMVPAGCGHHEVMLGESRWFVEDRPAGR